jgi:glutathione synthase
MRIALVLDRLAVEKPHATTIVLAHAAAARGHTVYLLDVLDLTYYPDGHVGGVARRVPAGSHETVEAFLEAVRSADAPRDRVSTAALDVLWLRQNPSEWPPELRRSVHAGILFGQLAVRRGVLVLDHPDTLAYAESKLYLEQFPEAVRIRTLITRDAAEIRRFHGECGGQIVLKPLDGYGGNDVFLVREDTINLNSIVASLARDGYVIAQEYLPAAAGGDTRLFMMNGKPLVAEGRYAAIHRLNAEGDFRSNMTAGGHAVRATIDDEMLAAADVVGPQLRKDGIFFAGLDIVGGRLIEINTISPGGLYSAARLEGVDFAAAVIGAVERKMEYRLESMRERVRGAGGPMVSNRELAGRDWGQ